MATQSAIKYPFVAILEHALNVSADESGVIPADKIPADKVLGRMLGVSERQIRNARLAEDGMVDAYLADAMITGLGVHPNAVFGFEGWVDVDPDVLEAEAVASEARKARKDARLAG